MIFFSGVLRRTGLRGLLAGLALSGVLAAPLAAHAQGAGLTGNVSLFLGSKVLNTTDWAPVEEHGEVGLVGTIGSVQSMVGGELRLLGSGSDTVVDPATMTVYELTTSELDLGGRFTFVNMSNMRPYLAGGLAMISAEPVVNGFAASGSGTGIWMAGGIYWILGNALTLGFDYMISHADVTIVGVSADAGGSHLNLQVGLQF